MSTNNHTLLGGGIAAGAIAGAIAGYPATHPFHSTKGIEIRITPANGGTIVSILSSNSYTSPELYVIPEDQHLGDEISKLITIHCLKKE